MKKKILYGLIALLSVSVLFLGCSTGTSNDSDSLVPIVPEQEPVPPAPASAADQAASVAGAIGAGAQVNGAYVEIVSPDGNPVTIPAGKAVSVSDAVTLVVTPNETLAVAGTVTNSGTIAVDANAALTLTGTITNTGDIVVKGTYTIDAAADGTNTGSVTVESGGIIISNAAIAGNGTNTVQTGGKVYFAADATGTAIIGDSTAAFDLGSDGEFSYGNGFYSVDEGTVTLTDSDGTLQFNTVSDTGTQVIIQAGATLVIDTSTSSARLRVTNSTAEKPAIQGVAGATIDLTGASSSNGITFDYPAQINFYDNTGTKIAPADNDTTVTAGTYTWKVIEGPSAPSPAVSGWQL